MQGAGGISFGVTGFVTVVKGVETWRQDVRRLSGNAVEIVEVGEGEIGRLLRGRRPMWKDVLRDAVVVYGAPLVELRAA